MITVIVPVYNVEKYVSQCLESIIKQSYQDLEIIVVDDGSTDKSGIICDELAQRDKRITVYHTDNHGLSAARNYAIDRAKGECIAFLDSDDWLETNAYERLISIATENNADVISFRFYQEYVNRTEESEKAREVFTVEGEDILKALVLEHRIGHDVWDKFYKASLFESIRYPEGRIFEDKATTYQILQKAQKLVYIPDCLIHYRNRENSLSNIHSMKSLVDYWTAYRERFDKLSQISNEYYKQSLSECMSAISRMWRWYAGCTKEEKSQAKETLNRMQQFTKEHSNEILNDPYYSNHVKWTCRYAKSRNPLVFKILYQMNHLYRSWNKNQYFAE